MQRLSGLDASFLYLETPSQPLHVCSILELDTSTMPGGYSFERVRDQLAARITSIPELRQKLTDNPLNLDHPAWVEDDAFDIDRHLHRIAVPPPGGRAELSDVCGRIAQDPLDRDFPLWEMWVIEEIAGPDALQADAQAGGRVVVMTKVHHASVDGVTGVDVLARLCGAQPDMPPAEPVTGPGPASSVQLAVSGLANFVTRPLRMAGMVPTTVSTVVDLVRRARGGRTMAVPFRAPRTLFNDKVTRGRAVAFAELDLEDVKKIKNRFTVTVNDVVTALCSDVLRRFLLERGQLPDTSLVATVPVSVHDKSDRPGRNQLSALFTRLETQIADPVDRLRAISRINTLAKEHSSAIGATLLLDWAQFAARTLFAPVMWLYTGTGLARRPIQNVVISNVPGPQAPLYFLGCRVHAMYPLGPIFHGAGLNITAMSLTGKLDIGIIACRQLVPDLWRLADGFETALKELLEAAA
jgi:diacylglycerol O-acyltransferase / wax synthase